MSRTMASEVISHWLSRMKEAWFAATIPLPPSSCTFLCFSVCHIPFSFPCLFNASADSGFCRKSFFFIVRDVWWKGKNRYSSAEVAGSASLLRKWVSWRHVNTKVCLLTAAESRFSVLSGPNSHHEQLALAPTHFRSATHFFFIAYNLLQCSTPM